MSKEAIRHVLESPISPLKFAKTEHDTFTTDAHKSKTIALLKKLLESVNGATAMEEPATSEIAKKNLLRFLANFLKVEDHMPTFIWGEDGFFIAQWHFGSTWLEIEASPFGVISYRTFEDGKLTKEASGMILEDVEEVFHKLSAAARAKATERKEKIRACSEWASQNISESSARMLIAKLEEKSGLSAKLLAKLMGANERTWRWWSAGGTIPKHKIARLDRVHTILLEKTFEEFPEAWRPNAEETEVRRQIILDSSLGKSIFHKLLEELSKGEEINREWSFIDDVKAEWDLALTAEAENLFDIVFP